MIICNRIFKVNRSSVYVVLGFFLGFVLLNLGVHATLAGFTTILCTPFREGDKDFPANFRRFNFILGLSFYTASFCLC
ncbi:MAG: Na+/H+ antiporter NhaA [Francisella endosymbiont of Hyalomma scupense]